MDPINKNFEQLSHYDFISIQNKKRCYNGPITGNIKCIIISLTLALLYWFLPKKNKYVLFSILYFTYLLIAYYDHYYDCRKGNFGPTFLRTFYSWAKPKNSKQNIVYSNLCHDKDKLIFMVDIFVFVLALVLAPLLIRWNPK